MGRDLDHVCLQQSFTKRSLKRILITTYRVTQDAIPREMLCFLPESELMPVERSMIMDQRRPMEGEKLPILTVLITRLLGEGIKATASKEEKERDGACRKMG